MVPEILCLNNLLQAGRYLGRKTGDPLKRKNNDKSVHLKALKSDVNNFANFVVNCTENLFRNPTAKLMPVISCGFFIISLS